MRGSEREGSRQKEGRGGEVRWDGRSAGLKGGGEGRGSVSGRDRDGCGGGGGGLRIVNHDVSGERVVSEIIL